MLAKQERLDTVVKAAKIGVWEWDVSANKFIATSKLTLCMGFHLAYSRSITLEDFIGTICSDDRKPYES